MLGVFGLLQALVLALAPFAAAQPDERPFRAGAALSNITPPLGSLIVGGWNPVPATSIHDELWARCLVLDDGRMRVAIVIADNLGIPRAVFDEAKRQIREKTGLPYQNMLMASTHTHSAASARERARIQADEPLDAYQRFVAQRIADGVLRALKNLEPARIGWGVGSEPTQVFNRRWRMKPGTILRNPFGGVDQVLMNPPVGDPNLDAPAGPTDPAIHFISLQSISGRPIALLANYSLHYVGGVPQGEISADYFGVFARRIEQLLGAGDQQPPFVGILSNGASGDINNINFRGPPSGRKFKPYEKMHEVAGRVAAEVYRVYQNIRHQDWAQLGAAIEEIPIALRLPGKADLEWAERVLKNPKEATLHPRAEIYAQRTLAMKDYPHQIPLILQALRIGDVGIVAIPNEVFVEIGLEIRSRSPFQTAFTIELANGAYGYLPTVAQHKLGGYETWRGTNILEVEAAPKIVETVIRLLKGLHPAAGAR